MKAKIIMLSALGVASFGLTQAANASWDSGACSGGGPAPCIEYNDGTNTYHFNGDGSHSGDWHGHPGGGDFQFTGYTDLGCSLGQFYCELTLTGDVRKFQDGNGDWRIGVRVNSGSVAQGSEGDNECSNISVGGFPWYVGDYPNDHTFGASSGMLYTGTSSVYTGNVGDIDVTYTVFGLPISLVTGGTCTKWSTTTLIAASGLVVPGTILSM